jgi:serine/threonine-protein kinase RsbT
MSAAVSTSTVSLQELRIEREDDVVIVRRKVKSIAQERKFDTFATAAITTATSELTRNVLMHGGGGVAIIEEISDGLRVGIRIRFRDHGPGIPDVERVLKGGYSTARSMGLGLSGSRRLVDEFSIDTAPGRGTTVTIVKWKPF